MHCPGFLAGVPVGCKVRTDQMGTENGHGLGQCMLLESGQGMVREAAFQGLRFTQCPILSLKVCLCVAANVAHSLQQNVLYLDSNGGMTASRLLQLLQARTQDEEEQVGGKMAGFL